MIIEKIINEIIETIKIQRINTVYDILNSMYHLKSERHGADGSMTVDFDGEKVTFLNAYGDEDDDLLVKYDKNTDEYLIVKIGFCLIYNKRVYCFDILIEDEIKVDNIWRSKELLTRPAIYYTGKRAFYHFRNEKFVSLRGEHKNGDSGSNHIEAENWTSGKRTKFELELFDTAQ